MDKINRYSQALSKFVLKAKIEDTNKFAEILASEGLILEANMIIENAKNLALAEIQKKKVLIKSARKLSEEERIKLVEDIEKKYGRDFIFEEIVDKDLIEGTVIEINGTKIDTSIRSKIKKLAKHLI